MVGTGHVLDAAAQVGATPRRRSSAPRPSSTRRTAPLTEHSPLDPNPSDDPYTVTKRAAYLDAMRRVEDDGQDICIVISGGAYGVSPLPERSMVAPSYNARIALALSRRDHRVRRLPDPVGVRGRRGARASVVATRKGVAGERYLAFGRPGDVGGVPWFCNAALEVAGPTSRVTEVAVAELDDPDVAARFGPSLVALARKHFPSPFFVNDQTVERLGLRAASPSTRAWPAPSPGCASTTCSDASSPAPKGAIRFI